MENELDESDCEWEEISENELGMTFNICIVGFSSMNYQPKSQPTQMGTKTSFLFFFLSFMNWISEGSVFNCIPTIVSYIDQLLRTRTLKEKNMQKA